MVRPYDSRLYPSDELPAEQGIAPDLFPINGAMIIDKRQRPERKYTPTPKPKNKSETNG